MYLLAVCTIVFVVCTIFTSQYVSKIQPEPYMDEIFHIPQVQHYCKFNFTHWDPMITTLPGLYLISVGSVKPLAALLDFELSEFCTTSILRRVNVVFALGNFYLIYAILKKLHNPMLDTDGVKLSMTAFALSTFPVLYFFSFLYYTDPGAIFFVLFMYLFCIHDSHQVASVLGVVAILFRQTNIIWVVFCAGLAVRKELLIWLKDILEKKDVKVNELNDWDMSKLAVQTVVENALKMNKLFFNLLHSVIRKVFGYVLVGLGFVLFVIINQGIVVGARSQHTACLHFPQLFYFLTMVNVFAIFHLTSPYKVLGFVKFCWKHPLIVLSFTAVAYVMVHYYTYEHMYILSDNRHFAFYIWHKIYRRHEYVKYILIPGYFYCLWAFLNELRHRDIFWKISFFICLCASTVPQKLLEYRYFILPYLIYRINMRYGSAVGLLHEILIYLAVNVATVYLFTQKPFKWAHEEGTQRFMW